MWRWRPLSHRSDWVVLSGPPASTCPLKCFNSPEWWQIAVAWGLIDKANSSEGIMKTVSPSRLWLLAIRGFFFWDNEVNESGLNSKKNYPGLGVELRSASLKTKCAGCFDLMWLQASMIIHSRHMKDFKRARATEFMGLNDLPGVLHHNCHTWGYYSNLWRGGTLVHICPDGESIGGCL